MSLSRKTLVVAVGIGFQSLLTQIGVNLILVRLLDSSLFGTYRQAWLVMNTLTPVFLFGVHFSVYYYLPSLDPEHRRAFALRCLGFLTTSGILMASLLYLSAPGIAALFSNPPLAGLLRLFSLYALFSLPALLLFHHLIALDRSTRATLYNIGVMLVQAVLIVGLVATGRSLVVLFQVLAVFALGRLLFSLWQLFRFAPGSRRVRLSLPVGAHLAYAIPVGITATVNIAGQRLDKFVVSSFLDPASYAVYSVGALEFPAILLVSMAAGTIMRPRLSQLHHEQDREAIHRFWLVVHRRMVVVLVPMAVFLGLFSRQIIEFLYTPEYGAAVPLFRILLLLTVFRIVPLEALLASVGRPRVVLTGGIVFLVLDLALSLVLIRSLGLVGPPLALLGSSLAMVLVYAWGASDYLGVAPGRLVSPGWMARVLAVSILAAAVSMLALIPDGGRLLTILVGAALFLTAYGLLGYRAGVITRGDLAIVQGFVPTRGPRSRPGPTGPTPPGV